MFLLVTEQQFEDLQNINQSHNDRRITPIKSINDNWLVGDYLLSDCNNPDDTWYSWKDWLLSLSATDETPKPRPTMNTLKPSGVL